MSDNDKITITGTAAKVAVSMFVGAAFTLGAGAAAAAPEDNGGAKVSYSHLNTIAGDPTAKVQIAPKVTTTGIETVQSVAPKMGSITSAYDSTAPKVTQTFKMPKGPGM